MVQEKQTIVRSITIVIALFAVCTAAIAQQATQYPTPARAGFHHCALIYDKPQRGLSEFMPLVARQQDGKPVEWLFDSYLFLIFSSPRGIGTSDGPTIEADWQYQLDRWFDPGRDLAALDAAIEQVTHSLGAPPAPRQVMFAIPYLNATVKDFGDVDGDGKSEDLSTPAGRRSVIQWYLAQAAKRFQAAGYHHLQLWGFYWMNEGISKSDEPIVRDVADQLHQAGHRFLWIPWYQAAGWERWRDFGFDVALMQPNYAFSSTHHGKVRQNRLAITAELARTHGLGVEIEAGHLVNNPTDRHTFLQYLADGAPDRLGYQQAATAYYLEVDMVNQVLASAQPEVRGMYDALGEYVAGRPVASPDPALRWTTDSGAGLGDYLGTPKMATSAEAQLQTPLDIGLLDVFLDEPDPKERWRGTVEVQTRAPGETQWHPAGWAMRLGGDSRSGRWQVITLSVGRKAASIRVNLRSLPGAQSPLLRGIALTSGTATLTHSHRAMNRSYQFIPAPPAHYGDNGHKLTDGVIPDTGFASGQTVGWIRTGATVCFDLGRAAKVARIEVHCQGGGYAAVEWPDTACAITSATSEPPGALSGTGSMSTDVRWLLPEPMVIDRRRSDSDMDGHLTFNCSGAPARYINLVFEDAGWLMLSEVRIFEGETNIAPQANYTLHPIPTSDTTGGGKYADDGARLTDGIIATQFAADQVTGWNDKQPRQVVVDLGSLQPAKTAIAWCLGGGLAGIYSPASVQVEASSNATVWQTLGTATKPKVVEDGTTYAATAYRVEAPADVKARFLRVTIRADKGWAMVSEIEVP